DVLLGNREIVVKPLGKLLSPVKGISGATILADGRVVLILDVNGLIRHGVTTHTVSEQAPEAIPKLEKFVKKVVMVVDDSITMRRVATKLLNRNNYDVVTAKDGVDALAQLEDVNPDVMLLDIEMPRMDGFELALHMKNEATYRDIPIIMITSRTGNKHRDHAMKIGVNKYMGKPYQEEELIGNISALVG
ncbi:MAG: response regulator, partial [Gammaproteobacteria bacterium]|nr:response regulator [Gammaproteobacteria bacterium]